MGEDFTVLRHGLRFLGYRGPTRTQKTDKDGRLVMKLKRVEVVARLRARVSFVQVASSRE